MWGHSIIEGDHGVQLKTLPKAVPKGRALSNQAVGKGSVVGSSLDRGVQGKPLLCALGSPVNPLQHGESLPASLRKSETKTQVCRSVP